MAFNPEVIILPTADDRERFLLPAAAARMLGVATSTLRRWAEEGKLQSGTTIGGHRRYRESEIARLAQGLGLEQVSLG